MTLRPATLDAPPTAFSVVDVDGQEVRVGVRRWTRGGCPLLIFNGIGASIEMMEPFTEALSDIDTVVFDIPGSGESPAPLLPYRFWQMARMADHLMTKLGFDGPFDVLGKSWGGALAQQYAFQYPDRCRRLIIAASTPGHLMVPGKLSVLAKMATPRRYIDPDYLSAVGGEIYGGVFRREPELLRSQGHHVNTPGLRGYLYQLIAVSGWSSLMWLPMIKQNTLIIAGDDDPIVPLLNAKVMAALMPNAKLHVIDDGHLFIITRAADVAALVKPFLLSNEP